MEKVEDAIYGKVEKIVEYSLTKLAEYKINKDKGEQTNKPNQSKQVMSDQEKVLNNIIFSLIFYNKKKVQMKKIMLNTFKLKKTTMKQKMFN